MPLMHVYYRPIPGAFEEDAVSILTDEACAEASTYLSTAGIALHDDDFFVISRPAGPLDRLRKCNLLIEINLHDVPQRTEGDKPDINAQKIADWLAMKAAELVRGWDLKVGVWLLHGTLGWATADSAEF